MPEPALTRKSFFVNPRTVRRVQKVLGVGTAAEAVRVALERVDEMETFWRFMTRTRAKLTPGSFERS